MLAMIVGRCCAMNFVADVIVTMTVAKCEELMTDVIARWQMEQPLSVSEIYIYMLFVSCNENISSS